MPISFNEIPNTRVPGVYVEFDNSQAMQGSTIMEYTALLCGQMLDSGTAEPLKDYSVTSVDQTKKLFGAGSMAALMAEKFIANNNYTSLRVMAARDDEAGVKASGKLTFRGSVTAPAPVCLYIAGALVRVSAVLDDDAEAIASRLAAAVSANEDLPVTASAEGGVLTLTAKNAGEAGNGIDLRFGYYAEDFPAGLAVDITPMAGGAGNPDVAQLIAAWGDQWYHIIAWPWTDRASLRALDTELVDRWGPMRHIDGVAFCGLGGTFADAQDFGGGDSRGNYAHISLVEAVQSPDWPCLRAAAVAGIVAYYGNIDPARPFQTLTLTGCLAPERADRLTMQEQQLLLAAGVATTSVDAGGTVSVQRLVTNYLTTGTGATDTSYSDVNTLLTLSYLRYDFRNRILRKYPRHKLAGDTETVPAGQAIMTPSLGKSEAVAAFVDWQNLGLVEDIEAFKSRLICERDAQDPNRLNWLLPPDLINQFRVGAAQIQFLL